MRKTANASYYICGSQPHRRGLGCGQAVYVPQEQIESEVVTGLTSLLDVCADATGFARKVNAELRSLWEESTGCDPAAPRKLADIDAKIANIRSAVENGLPDAAWAFSRMSELQKEREALSRSAAVVGEAPQIDWQTALSYRQRVDSILASGTNAEKKRLIRSCVDRITLAPDTLEVEITYKVPEAIGACSGSGGRVRSS